MKKLIPLFLLAVLFITGCDLSGLSITTTNQQPVINSFSASPSNISAGETSTLNWTVTGAATVSIDQGIGTVALTGPRAVTPAATTIYMLTASNTAGSVTATTQVIVSGAPSSSEPTPSESTPSPSEGLPVVNYFMANPSVISYGGSTTLGWNVSNATSVTIDPGVGPMASVGTAPVSPATSTNYTLTAANAVGMYYMTITVLVTGAPAAGQPDLIIEDISRSGDKVSYKIKNQGDVTAGPSTSTLLVDGAVAANDSVSSLAVGESKTETFTGYTYACTLPGDAIVVKADTSGAVVESSEANNSYTESWSCLLLVVPMFTLKPDLVVEDIWIDGHTIRYRIKNEGTGASSIGYSRLYIDGAVKGNDLDVPVIAAGASLPRSFTYNFDCALPIIKEVKVTADRGGTSTESDETNNSRTENLVCP
jgi:hypothetical protein